MNNEHSQAVIRAKEAEGALNAYMIHVDASKDSALTIAKQDAEIHELKRILIAKKDDVESLNVSDF